MSNRLNRLFFILYFPVKVVNVLFGFIMILPYWIWTGKIYYDSLYFKKVMYFIDLLPSPPKTETK